MELYEKQLEREEIYNGVVLHVVRDKVALPNGRVAYREMCLHKGAVAVVPLTADGNVIMERQFRYAHNRVFLEIPAGKLDRQDENPLDAAKRELKEETGAVAKKYTPLGALDTTPALVNEKIYMYLAEDIEIGERKLDPDEFIDVELIPLSELIDMVMKGEIQDAKTQIAILKVARLKKMI
ncbi:MAG: NUDIX hydrolase [Clostridia bacterium]|nr:NUDIX hydrolase [Clostridia bacterium]